MEYLIDQQNFEEMMEFEMKEAERDYEASKRNVGNSDYSKRILQPWDIIDAYQLNFYEGNILKYLLRSKDDRVEDLEKLIHYAEKEIENERNRTDTTV